MALAPAVRPKQPSRQYLPNAAPILPLSAFPNRDVITVEDDDVEEIESPMQNSASRVKWKPAAHFRNALECRDALFSYYDLHRTATSSSQVPIELTGLHSHLSQIKRMVILRGLPGSGKSTRAAEIVRAESGGSSGVIHSADDYFYSPSGVYNYNPALLGRAHLSNRARSLQAAENGNSPIVIDNTNLSIKEMKPYVQIAKKYGYVLEIEESSTPWRNNPRVLGMFLAPFLQLSCTVRLFPSVETLYTCYFSTQFETLLIDLPILVMMY